MLQPAVGAVLLQLCVVASQRLKMGRVDMFWSLVSCALLGGRQPGWCFLKVEPEHDHIRGLS